MLCISEKEILEAVTLKEVSDTVEAALVLYETKEFHMPRRMHLDYEGNSLLLMPCFTREKFSTKLVSVFPGNTERDVPVVIGTMILNDGETGKPLALLDGTKLTALRTGAVGAVAVRHTTPQDIHTLGIVGAGVQGFHQALFACQERKISDIRVFDQVPGKVDHFVKNLVGMVPGVKTHWAGSAEELVMESELIITATNSSRPVLPDKEDLLKNKHFIGIGSYKPDMREFPASLFRLLDRMFVDTDHAAAESGDLIDPLENGWIRRDQVLTLGKLIRREVQGDTGKGTPTLFKSVGMALFDLKVADLIYQKAVAKGLGTRLDL